MTMKNDFESEAELENEELSFRLEDEEATEEDDEWAIR
jgi:hypothetical protein